MQRLLISLMVLIHLFSSIVVVSNVSHSDPGRVSSGTAIMNDSTRSPYPIWTIGDSYNYTQTHFNSDRYESYTYWNYHEVMNRTTVTTPEGNYDVYGVKGTGYASWVGKPPFSDGFFRYFSNNYYRVSDLASVSSSSYTMGSTYYSNSTMYYKPPKDSWDYPVGTGERWNTTHTYHYHSWGVASGHPYDNEGDYTSTTAYECQSRGTTTVQAGAFTTYKIRSGTDPSSYSIMYLDVEMGWYVKHEVYSNGMLDSITELNSTTFEHPPVASAESFDFSMQEDRTDSTSIDVDDIFSSEKNLNYSAESESTMNVTINDDGSVEFRPKRNWYGITTIILRADDGLKNSTKEISITVTPVNDPPYFDDLPHITFFEGGSDDTLDLDDYAGDVDDDIDDLTYSLEPTENIVARLIAGNVLEFTSIGNWYGEENVEIGVMDDEAYSNKGYVLVTVTKINDAPVIEDVEDRTVPQYGYLNLTLAATDPDYLDTVTFHTDMFDTMPDVQEGFELFCDMDTGEFLFHPSDQDLVGVYEVAFWAFDGTARDYSNITITVENVNDPPVVEGDFHYEIIDADPVTYGDNNLTVVFSAPLVSDIDGDEVSYKWDFGDESEIVSGRNVSHTYAEPGNYSVVLEITDGMITAPIIQGDTVSVTAPVDEPGDDENLDDGGTGNDGDDDAADDEEGEDEYPSDGEDDHDDDDGPGGVAGDDDDVKGPKDGGGHETGDSKGSAFPLWALLFIIVFSIMILIVIVVIIVKASGKTSVNDNGMPENDPVLGGRGQFTGVTDLGRIAGPHETWQTENRFEYSASDATCSQDREPAENSMFPRADFAEFGHPINGWQTTDQYSTVQDPWDEMR